MPHTPAKHALRHASALAQRGQFTQRDDGMSVDAQLSTRKVTLAAKVALRVCPAQLERRIDTLHWK